MSSSLKMQDKEQIESKTLCLIYKEKLNFQFCFKISIGLKLKMF